MIEQWQELKETITEMRDNDGTGTQQDACKFLVDYMEVLEKQMQEPCEDCISREAVQDLISRWLSDYLLDETREALETINYKVGDMPSVTPRTNLARTSQDCISRQKALDCFEQTNTRQGAKYAIGTLPSVTPQPKKGKWIYKWMKGQFCSECDEQSVWKFNYCPNCGAEMEVEDEISD